MNAQQPSGGGQVLVISQYSLPPNKSNMNVYQRVVHGARHATVRLLVRKSARISREVCDCVRLHRAPWDNRVLFLLYSAIFCLWAKRLGVRVVLTEPSGLAIVGLLASRVGGLVWALDVWDRPRWRTGSHEAGSRPPLGDRIVFWAMRHADLFLLSVLPEAAKDIAPAPERCIQLFNAIEMTLVREEPVALGGGKGDVLEVSYGRSKFWDTMGMDVVLGAARILRRRGCRVRFHLIGQISDQDQEGIRNSPEADMFVLHGFTDVPRTEMFRRTHVGLVPYLEFEDLKYIFPIKVLEHLSQGNPVIASGLPGLLAMVKDGYNGRVVRAGDPNELADAVEDFWRRPWTVRELSLNALRSIREFDVRRKHRRIFHALAPGLCDGRRAYRR